MAVFFDLISDIGYQYVGINPRPFELLRTP